MNNDYTILKKENKYLEKKFKIKYDNEKKEYRLKNSDFSFFNGDFNKAKELGGVFINEISKIALKNSDFSFFNMDFNKAKELGAIYIEEIKKFVIKNSDFLFFSNVNSDEERKKVDDLKAFYIKDLKKYVIKYSILNKYNILNWYKNLAEDINVNTNNASIFIGRRIETDLLRSLSKAKKRIYIISPYISDKNVDLCSEILKDSTKNIDFKMITSLDIENPNNYIKLALKKLITVELDKSKEEEIQKIKNEIDSKYKSVEKANKIDSKYEIVTEKTNETPYQDDLNFFFTFIISILILLLFFNSKLLIIFSILFSLFYFFNRKNRKNKNDKNDKNKNDKNNNNNVFYNRDKIESEIKNLQEKLKNYFITSRKISNLNFKVINDDFKNNDDFLHIKMYIIDDTVYLGSLNFTITAFSRNIESLIKIENPDITEKLKNYFENLYENKDNKEYEFLDDISIAKTIYSYDDFFKNNQQNT